MADFYSSLTLSVLISPLQTLSFNEPIGSQTTFIWIPGHIGFSEHYAVDKAAKQAITFPKMNDFAASPSPISKLITAHTPSNHGMGNPTPK